MPSSVKLSSKATHEFWEIPVLFEDPTLLAIDKPASLLSTPDATQPDRPNLMRLLYDAIKRGTPWAAERALTYLGNPHRLDSEMTGVFLLAKNKAAMVALNNQFGADLPTRIFLAIVPGSPAEDAFEVTAPMLPHPRVPGLMCVEGRAGRKAVTRFAVRERFDGYTLLACQPLTNRLHQVRVHLRHYGMTLAGDQAYGGRPLLLSDLKPDYRLKPDKVERPLLGSPSLHAEELGFKHPETGIEVVVRSPWPHELTVAVKYLRRYRGTAWTPPPGAPPPTD